jgi:hypothetical protein
MGENGGIPSCILNLNTECVVELHAIAALPLGKQPRGTHWLGGWVGLNQSGPCEEQAKYLAPTWNRTATPRYSSKYL